jgi:ABC-type uncharacterized transport system involved in gliding motility auxiliary subunit
LSGTHQKSFYIVKGYGKINEFAKLKETLKHENWYIEEIYLDDLAEISRKGNAVLMIDGPENDLSEKEIGGLEQYLNSGGKVIILLEPFTKINNLKAFLEKCGIELPEEIIIDQKNKLYGGDYLAPLIPYYAKVPVTDQMSMSSLFSTVRPVDMKKGGSSNGASVMALASSSENSWTKKSREDVLKGRIDYLDGIDRPGPVPVAALSTMLIPDKRGISKSSEIICFGDGDFIKDSFIEIMGNQDLFLNAVEWLARDYTLISIREKQFIYPYQFLSSRQGSILFQVSVILLPLIFLITCVAIFFYRRIRG